MSSLRRIPRPRIWRPQLLLVFVFLTNGGGARAARLVDPVAYLRLCPPGHTSTVNALAFSPDSQTLYSAGSDKVVRAWREGAESWTTTTPMRWEVGHGVNGRIYGLAVDPLEGAIAIAGRGNRGAIGEVVWFDADQPKLFRSWRFPTDDPGGGRQHEQVVRSLAFSPSGAWFASADLDGKVLLWDGAARQPRGELRPPARLVSPPDRALWETTSFEPGWRPIAWAGERHLIYPHLDATNVKPLADHGPTPFWSLRVFDPSTGASRPFGDPARPFPGYVLAIAASADGRFVAVGGLDRVDLYRRDDAGAYSATTLETTGGGDDQARALAFSPDGKTLVIGRGSDATAELSVVEIDTDNAPRTRLSQPLPESVDACAVSPDGRRVAFAAGHDVYTLDLAATGPAEIVRLAGGPRVTSVGFVERGEAAGATTLRVDTGGATWLVDPQADPMVRKANDDAPPLAGGDQSLPAGWRFDPARRTLTDPRGRSTTFDYPMRRHGPIGSNAWRLFSGPDGRRAIALGTTISGAVFVYEVPGAGADAPRLLRKFVGHEGAVAWLAANAGGERLASGSDDGSASLWSLAGLWDADPLTSAWGVRFDDADGDAARVAWLDTNGPLFNRGVRVGDRLVSALRRGAAGADSTRDPKAIRRRLASVPPAAPQAELYLEHTPADAPNGEPIGHNYAPVWSPLLSVYCYGDAWVAWTPTGHYDASVGGDRLIGWQQNRELGRAPSFAKAIQHNGEFYRPNLLRELLVAETPAAEEQVAAVLQETTVDNEALPKVRVLEQRVDPEGEVLVQVEVETPSGAPADEVAVIDESGRKVGRAPGPIAAGKPIEIAFKPVSYRPQRFGARAYGSDGIGDSLREVTYDPSLDAPAPPEEHKPVLYLLSVGVSAYDEAARLAPLAYADLDAFAVRDALVGGSRLAYDRVESAVLTSGPETTGASLRRRLSKIVAEAMGGDTICIYFAGHSLSDVPANFVDTPADSEEGFTLAARGRRGGEASSLARRRIGEEVSMLPSDGGSAALTFRELVEDYLDDSLARKVVILDTCHSGAATARLEEYERACALRDRENDRQDRGIRLYAACAADEEAHEDPKLKMGVFTSLVVEGLRGDAASRKATTVTARALANFLGDADATDRLAESGQTPAVYLPATVDGRPNAVPLVLTRIPAVPAVAERPAR